MTLENTGGYHANVPHQTVSVSTKYGKVGKMTLPKLTLHEARGTNFEHSSMLLVTNRKLFSETVARLLNGQEVQWFLHNRADVDLLMAGSKVKVNVKLNYTLVLSGSNLQNGLSTKLSFFDVIFE